MRLACFTISDIEEEANGVPQGVKLISAPKLWEAGYEGAGIRIAVIDTGCDVTRLEFKDRIIGGYNFTDEDGGKEDLYVDYNGHGTHICGTIAASMTEKGIVGVAPKAKLLILKAIDKNGIARYNWIINAIKYAIREKVDIISMSLGGKTDDLKLHAVIKKAVEENILVVCAAGNEKDMQDGERGILYPAYYNECISVGSIDYKKERAYVRLLNTNVDLVAPGVDILSTYIGGKYSKMSGTSMATPHVTGALALIINWAEKEFGRRLTEPELYAQLIKRTINPGYSTEQVGSGILYLTAIDLLNAIVVV